MDEVRVGFIGCGGNARGHMRQHDDIEASRIVAVCDVVEELAQKAADDVGADAYTDMYKMLERDDLDAVVLSIPVFAHGEPEKAVIDRGLPFLVEKPVARHMETAQEVQELVDAKGLTTAVGYQLRYGGAAQKAKAYLADKTISLVMGTYWSGTGRATIGRWQNDMSKSGGQLLEQATHTLDMIRYLVGEVTEVSCRAATRTLVESNCNDTHVVNLAFAGGALGVLGTCWDYDNRDWSHANVVDIVAGQDIVHWQSAKLAITHEGKTTEETLPSPTIDAIFVEAVRTGDGATILSPYADGVKSLAVSLAALESAETGRPVALA